MKEVLIALNQQPIAVYPIYIDITGSVTAGLLLSQVMYWNAKMKGKEFYKNDSEYMEETRLTQSEFKTAKKIISELSFLNVERKGAPYRTYYSIDHDELFVVLQRFSSSFTYELGSRLSTNRRGVNLRTIKGTENTQENTQENTTLPENSFSDSLLSVDEIEDLETQIYKTNLTQKRKKVAPKKEKVEAPTPIQEMFKIYKDAFASLNSGHAPIFMKKYCIPLQRLYEILDARYNEKALVKEYDLQPWEMFLKTYVDYLKNAGSKERWLRDNFDPSMILSNFNSIIAKLLANKSEHDRHLDKAAETMNYIRTHKISFDL